MIKDFQLELDSQPLNQQKFITKLLDTFLLAKEADSFQKLLSLEVEEQELISQH